MHAELLGQFGETAIAYHMAIKAQYALLLAKVAFISCGLLLRLRVFFSQTKRGVQNRECLEWTQRFLNVLRTLNIRLVGAFLCPSAPLSS